MTMIVNDYVLFFSQHYNRSPGLEYGRLSLNTLGGGVISVWRATSSIASKQYPESFHERGGIIPPPYRCENLDKYSVQTNAIALPHVKGIEGNFYKINPHFVVTDKGGQRSDFGIHLDGNIPGSMGCIVMSKNRFDEFEREIGKINAQGIKNVPLFVHLS